MTKVYFLEDLLARVEGISADTRPSWGIMTAQHMVEHIVGAWRISNGNAQVKCYTPVEKLPGRRDFLFSDNPYPKGLRNPVIPEGLPKLRKPDLEAALLQLRKEMETFFSYHQEHPNPIFTHPVFGDLTRDEWLVFQKKHMGHHMTQFGL